MISCGRDPGYRHSKANEDRARSAARRQASAARAALAVLAARGIGSELSSTAVWRRLWIDVLRRRATDDVSTLGGLAATMSPPMTKDAFAGQLRRACRFAAEVDASARGSRARATAPAGLPDEPGSPDFYRGQIESRACAEGFIVDPSAPAAGEVRRKETS